MTLIYRPTNYDNLPTWDTPPVKGLPTSKADWLAEQSRYVTTRYSYDAWGNVVSVSDPTNRTVTSTFDTARHLFPTSTTNAANETTTAVWDPICGVPTQQTNVNGQVATMQYDALCRPTRTDAPLGGYTIYSYLNLGDPNNQRVRVEAPSAVPGDSNDYAMQYFDGFGRGYKTVKKGPSAGQDIHVDTAYNVRGGVSSQTAPYYSGATPQTTSYTYDVLNRVVRTTLPDGNQRDSSYLLWSATSTDEHGHPVSTTFDGYGRPVTKTQELNGAPIETTSTYDIRGRLVGMTDQLGNDWTWTFDSLGRVTQKSDPDAGNMSYTYDDAGRVLTQTDAKSQQTSFTYDSVGRLASKTYLGTNAGGTTETVTITRSEARTGFFNKGEVTRITAPYTTLTIDYDALGRAVKQTRTIDTNTYTVQERFDAMGRVLGTTYPDGDVVGSTASPLTYDSAGRLIGIPGIVTGITYDAAGRPLVLTNANGTTTTRTYTADRSFLTRIQTLAGGTMVQDQSYTPDASGMVTQVTSPFANETWSYAYDSLHRLLSATSSVNPANNQTFQYDEIGRITFNSRVGNYTYPAPGNARPHAPMTAGSNSYSYDPNGNLTAGAGRTISWNGDNRITQLTVGGVTSQYLYDGFGERLVQLAGSTASFYPFGDDYEVTGTTVTKYISAAGLGVIAKRVGTTTHWMHTDRLGSIESITTSPGAVALRRTYRPYGDKLADTGSHTESRGWIQQRQDGSALTYLHARYYDASLGLFLSPDPSHPISVGTNSFAYALGDPIGIGDPTGLGCRSGTHFVPPDSCVPNVDRIPGDEWFGPPKGRPSGDLKPEPYPPHCRTIECVCERHPKAPHCTPSPKPSPSPSPSPTPTPTPKPGPTPDPTPCSAGFAASRCDDDGGNDEDASGNPTTVPEKYVDSNVTALVPKLPFVVGTAGLMFESLGLPSCAYAGGGLGTRGVSLTSSKFGIARGWNVAGTGSVFGFVLQIGRGGGSFYAERGIGFPGWSLTAFYVACR